MLPANLPRVLQYGLPGLAAVITVLAYRLLLSQSRKEKPNPSLLEAVRPLCG